MTYYLLFPDKTSIVGGASSTLGSTSTATSSHQSEPNISIPIQTGSGGAQTDFTTLTGLGSSEALHHIAELVVKSLIPVAVSQFQNYNLGPPAQVNTENPDTRPPLSYNIVHQKDDLNDKFDEAQLLKTLPPKFRRVGQILLKQFNDQANQITWTTDGSLLIDEISIPKSNIFVLFPLLFKFTKSRDVVPGLNELILKIDEMGLAHLIKRKPLKSSTREAPAEKLKASATATASNTKWWYIG